MNETTRVSDTEYNLILDFIIRIHLDEVIDITSDDSHDYFWDFEEDKELSLKEGFEVLAEAKAEPFEHEGFNAEEANILTECFRRFVPNFED